MPLQGMYKSALTVSRKQLVELEMELQSLDTRILDLEWQYEMLGNDEADGGEALLDQRRRAIDKKKHIIKDIAKLRSSIIDEQSEA